MNIGEKLTEYKRVLRISRKPSKDEFKNTSKICILGIFLIGFIGFAIFLAFVLAGI